MFETSPWWKGNDPGEHAASAFPRRGRASAAAQGHHILPVQWFGAVTYTLERGSQPTRYLALLRVRCPKGHSTRRLQEAAGGQAAGEVPAACPPTIAPSRFASHPTPIPAPPPPQPAAAAKHSPPREGVCLCASATRKGWRGEGEGRRGGRRPECPPELGKSSKRPI